MQYYDVAFTLGRTQPPHIAHFKMLLDALLTLNETGKLIHFVGSTNIPRKFSKGEKNILSFEERRDMLTEGLLHELKELYKNDPSRIPAKYADRIKNGQRVLSPSDFECIALPDFSDENRQFSNNKDTSTIERPYEGVRSEAMQQVISEKMAVVNEDNTIKLDSKGKVVLTDAFAATLTDLIEKQGEFHIPVNENVIKEITLYGQPYMGWAINLRNELNTQINEYKKRTNIENPIVAYQCCDKDKSTLQYILLVAAVIEFVQHQYTFKLVLTPIEMLDATNAVSATYIRDAYVAILTDPEQTIEALEASIRNPSELLEKYPILAHMHEHGRVIMLKAMQALKKIADNPESMPIIGPSSSPSVQHTVQMTPHSPQRADNKTEQTKNNEEGKTDSSFQRK